MIDGVKIIYKDVVPSELEASPYLDFYHRNINRDTGQVRIINRKGKKVTPYKYAEYRGLEFRVYDTGTIIIMGSLHKYYNNGEHNYNDFTRSMFLEVVEDLNHKFDLNPVFCVLQNLETGVNIFPPILSNTILDHCFLHKKTPFVSRYDNDKGRYIQVEHSQYIVKIYNKALQYDVNGEILRFEIKFTKMEKLNGLGVFTLKDLVDFDFKEFTRMLTKEWKNILFYDPSIGHKTVRLGNYRNPLYWKDMIKTKSDSTYYKHIKILRDLIVSHSDNNKEKIKIEIRQKANSLIQFKGTEIDHLYIGSSITPQRNIIRTKTKKFCQLTGADITMQKDDSFLLSHTGLWYYRVVNPKLYAEVMSVYLTAKWRDVPLRIQIREASHNIRNHYYNWLRNQRNKYVDSQCNMLGQLGLEKVQSKVVKPIRVL